MENLVYSFDPRVGHSSHEEVRAGKLPAATSPQTAASPSWQREDGDDEHDRQVANIMAATRPLRMRL